MITPAQEAMLELAVNAAGGGHDLAAFEPVKDKDGRPDGFQARCKLCGATCWAGSNGVLYSLLEDVCPGPKKGNQL